LPVSAIPEILARDPNSPTNETRADWGLEALQVFAARTGLTVEEDGLETVLGDLLADLMHLCRQADAKHDVPDQTFDEALRRAQNHFSAELMEERMEMPMSERRFAVRVVGTGADPLGDLIPGDNAFFTMTVHESGTPYEDLDCDEGGCVRRGTTADAKQRDPATGKVVPILYKVTRVT